MNIKPLDKAITEDTKLEQTELQLSRRKKRRKTGW